MIVIESLINSSLEDVWNKFTQPQHIINWYFASPDWHSPTAENDLKVGGKFKTRMEAKDGSMGFDFEGVYTLVQPLDRFEYKLADDRKVIVEFKEEGDSVKIIESFDPENENPHDMQQAGWQMILNNFKTYAETK
ncbi:MAG: SRPBCC family protein [Sphingobacteriaceae bacterium]